MFSFYVSQWLPLKLVLCLLPLGPAACFSAVLCSDAIETTTWAVNLAIKEIKFEYS